MDFDKIVKKLSRKPGFPIGLDDLAEYVDPGYARGAEGKRDTYKLAYRLKAENVLLPIRNGLFLVRPDSAPGESGTGRIRREEESRAMQDIRLIEDAYWRIVKKIVTTRCGSSYLIGGPKSLEIRMRDLSIPDTLIVYTRHDPGTVAVADRRKIVFKTVASGGKTGRTNAFPHFAKLAETFEIDGAKFKVACAEHAVLDSLTVHKGMPEPDEYAVMKFLSKYAKTLRREVLGTLVSFKYLKAVNRLREIARDRGGMSGLYEKALDVVKREGGNCFVSSGK